MHISRISLGSQLIPAKTLAYKEFFSKSHFIDYRDFSFKTADYQEYLGKIRWTSENSMKLPRDFRGKNPWQPDSKSLTVGNFKEKAAYLYHCQRFFLENPRYLTSLLNSPKIFKNQISSKHTENCFPLNIPDIHLYFPGKKSL